MQDQNVITISDKPIVYETPNGDAIKLTMNMVKNYLVSGKKELVTETEIVYFMNICKARKLNPFIKDCYLIKYDQTAAAIITSREFFQKNARKASDCKGWNFGIIVQDAQGKLRYSKGIVLEAETLIGGWFKGQPEGWAEPFELEVNLNGYLKKRRDGTLTQFWTLEKQAMMIAKVAEVQGLRALWGEESSGMYTADEIPEAQALDFSKTPGGAYEQDVESTESSAEFAFAIRDIANDPLFEQWLQVCANSNEITIEQVRAEAMKDISVFKNAFATWKISRQKESEKPTDTWEAFRAKWINLKKGFETFMAESKNQQLFRLAKDEKPDLYNEGRNKYINKIGKPWPLDSVGSGIAPEQQQESETSDTDRVEGETITISSADEGKDKGEEETDVSTGSKKDVYQSKEWLELAMLKEKHPVEYASVVNEPKVSTYLGNPDVSYTDKINWIMEAIARIDAKVDKNEKGEDEGEIPDGEEKF